MVEKATNHGVRPPAGIQCICIPELAGQQSIFPLFVPTVSAVWMCASSVTLLHCAKVGPRWWRKWEVHASLSGHLIASNQPLIFSMLPPSPHVPQFLISAYHRLHRVFRGRYKQRLRQLRQMTKSGSPRKEAKEASQRNQGFFLFARLEDGGGSVPWYVLSGQGIRRTERQ